LHQELSIDVIAVVMIASGIETDVAYYTMVLGLCNRNGDIQRAQTWFSRLKVRGVAPSMVSYNLLINAQARASDTSDVVQTLTEMQVQDLNRDRVSFNTVIKAFARKGDVSGAEVWFREIQRAAEIPMWSATTC